jgi:hypothetical protein
LAGLALVAWGGLLPPGASARQEVRVVDVAPAHETTLFRRVEGEVHAALLTEDGDARGRHLAAAEQIGRYLVEQDSMSAEAHYWLAVTLGVKTEYSGPFQKLTSGREVFFTTAKVLELDPEHPGGHEMMGRLHSAVMRLPWLVRGLALRMGMGQVLGEASWERAEHHFLRSAALDPSAIAPRVELAKLYLDQDRVQEARPVLLAVAALRAGSVVDERLLDEARALLLGTVPAGSAVGG